MAHRRYWDLDDWKRALSITGLSIVQQKSYFHCSEVRRWETISRWTAGALFALLGTWRRSPIEIQRGLGLRQAQNRLRLPVWIAWPLAKLMTAGLPQAGTMDAALLISAAKAAAVEGRPA